ncbi:hypothetical protein [Oceaniglobus trochenteri]|uniref:hypothetical protein n=1 Tax=Oceaniglobus trochenteri TaxID=2763260 RepID=UPI001CFF688B|nr:hypothetical protein [Oceaniglobus trochenteri]
MIKKYLAVGALTGLAACSGGEFLFPDGEDEETPVATTTYSNEVNKVEYDSENDELVINNLPFDGPDGVYERVQDRTEVNGFGVYTSLQTEETGQRRYYAVFRRTENGAVSAVSSSSYRNFGFGGTSIARTNDLTTMPTEGEYVYSGLYGGVRTFSDRSGLELVKGDVLLEVDIADFDETGAVEGRVNNRVAYDVGGVPLRPMPNIIFTTTSIAADTGVIEEGTASTIVEGATRDTGTYQGLFVGKDGEEIVGTVSLTGTFHAYRIIETVDVTDDEGNVTQEERALPYTELLAIRAAGDQERLDRIEISETSEGYQARELGVFTTAD